MSLLLETDKTFNMPWVGVEGQERLLRESNS